MWPLLGHQVIYSTPQVTSNRRIRTVLQNGVALSEWIVKTSDGEKATIIHLQALIISLPASQVPQFDDEMCSHHTKIE